EPRERAQTPSSLGFWGEADAVRVMPREKKSPLASAREEKMPLPSSLRESSYPSRDFFTGLPTNSQPDEKEKSLLSFPSCGEKTISAPSPEKNAFFGRADEKPVPAQNHASLINACSSPCSKKISSPEPLPSRQSGSLPPEASQETESPLKGFRYLGQIARTYLVLSQNDETLLLLDQHAMHERIFYEKFRSSGSRGTAQPLLVPLELEMHPSEAERLLELKDTLLSLGFETSCRGKRCLIQSIPPEMDRKEAAEFLREALDGKADDLESVWIHHACATAIRAGQSLTQEDAMTLIRQWLHTESPDFCPHGRPCAVTLEKADLEKLFKRRQS
ncbi:MAG: hypothetical protein ACI4P0_04365, partial [Mailhella sp.]